MGKDWEPWDLGSQGTLAHSPASLFLAESDHGLFCTGRQANCWASRIIARPLGLLVSTRAVQPYPFWKQGHRCSEGMALLFTCPAPRQNTGSRAAGRGLEPVHPGQVRARASRTVSPPSQDKARQLVCRNSLGAPAVS